MIVTVGSGAVILVVAGVLLLVTFAYLKTPQGQKAIRDGAVAIHKSSVVAGKAISKATKATVKLILAVGVWVWNKATSLSKTKDKAGTTEIHNNNSTKRHDLYCIMNNERTVDRRKNLSAVF